MYVEASMELGPEDVSLLEKCPHFRGSYVEACFKVIGRSGQNMTWEEKESCMYIEQRVDHLNCSDE